MPTGDAPVEIMRAKIQLQTDQRQLSNDQILKIKHCSRPRTSLFLPLDTNIAFVTDLEFTPFNAPLRRLLDYAILHNPSLQTLRRAKELALLNYQAAVEPTRPTFSLNGTYGAADADTDA